MSGIVGIILIFIFFAVVASSAEESEARYGIFLLEDQIVEVVVGDFIDDLIIKPCEGECRKRPDAVTPAPFDPVVVLDQVPMLQVHGIRWPSLPEGNYSNVLGTVEFYNVTPHGGFGSCPELSRLEITSGDLSMTSSDWLNNCTKLNALRVTGFKVTQLRTVMLSAVQIKYFYIVDLVNVEELAYSVRSPIFSNSSNITKITIESDEYLEHKNTSWAEVSAGMLWQFSLLPRLQELLINFDGFDMCAEGFPAVTLKSLRILEIYNDNTTRVCFRHYRKLPMLERLNFGCLLWHECRKIEINIKVMEIFSRPGHNLTVAVSNRNVNFTFQLSRAEYLVLSSEPQKKVVYFDLYFGLSVDCDCSEMFWLMRAIKMGYVTASSLKCRNGLSFAEFVCDRMECDSVPCNSKCLCCHIGPSDQFILDCRGLQLTQLPPELVGLPNLTEVYAPNSNISFLPRTLPETLRLVDVSGNQIRDIHEALLAEETRRWRLAGNPLTCACDNTLLLDTLQHRKYQIEDLENVKCVNETLERSLQTLPDVCKSLQLNATLAKEKESKILEAKLAKEREKVLVISVAMVTVVAILASMIGLAFYYRRPIQILLYARGWCLCWLQDEISDDDRLYDVFLSFCHEDSELVFDKLLPTLDQEYSVCVHLRDWMPGEMIPTQIRKSVQASRRTLIFLTKNFAKSLWGLLEFQTAYASGLEERRIRVVMIVVDDVLESPDLHKDLREYVRFNTYVRWDDPWFWSKLRYALPHKASPFPSTGRQTLPPALAADAPLQVLSINAPSHISSPEAVGEIGNSLPHIRSLEASPNH